MRITFHFATFLVLTQFCLTILLPNYLLAIDYFSVSDPINDSVFDCRVDQDRVEPGKLSIATNRFRFLKTSLEQVRRRIAKKPANIKILKQNLKKKQKEYNRKRKICKNQLLNAPTPRATNTPSDSATPKPTSTNEPRNTPVSTPTLAPTATSSPSGCLPCFDAQRNTSCFTIPSDIQGNEINGAKIISGCIGCHSESSRRNRSFEMISAALKNVSAMKPFANSYSTKDIADLAAYLNRFNPKQCQSDWP